MTELPPPKPPITIVQPAPAGLQLDPFIVRWNKRGWTYRLRCFPGLLDELEEKQE